MEQTSPQPWRFTSPDGEFRLNNPHQTSYLYFPLVNEAGMISVVTPTLNGDTKTGQHTFLTLPVSAEDLHNTRSARNFWVTLESGEAWSATGNAAAQVASGEDEVTLEAGFLWHKVTRCNARLGLQAEITSLVPATGSSMELMKVTLTNTADAPLRIVPTAAIPLYARSADNVRDHRHVTALLHRIWCDEDGVWVRPSLSFDERGHQANRVTYAVLGAEADGHPPAGFFPVAGDFIGEGGSFDWPAAVRNLDIPPCPAGTRTEGYEAVGAIRFHERMFAPGEAYSYVLTLAILPAPPAAEEKTTGKKTTPTQFDALLRETELYWQEKLSTLTFHTGDAQFDAWAKWVTIQPIFRRMFGNSFLPYHDYGRGGRGWRDLWQDILALLLLESGPVDALLYGNFAGVRLDGSNATIIGSRPGEFKADRNNIPRVWMDHGAWPLMTTQLYLDQSGDLAFLLRPQVYFKDGHIRRCKARDAAWDASQGTQQRTSSGETYQGSILEHLLVQHLTAFFHVGEHNNILLEGADWNDGMDMAARRGESVAFTAFYAGNLRQLAQRVCDLGRLGIDEVELMAELLPLLDTQNIPVDYASPSAKQSRLNEYFDSVEHAVCGGKVPISLEALAADLQAKADWLAGHLRQNEWIQNGEGYGWFNGYYDDDAQRLEGDYPTGTRMTLTGQVFELLGGIANDEQAREILRAVDHYLFDPSVGGYRLNTDFGDVLTNVGRCLGFAYGHKENGAMFSHMAVMYAYALYERGFAHEGQRALHAIYQQAVNFPVSRMYPGIPEYFDARGRGVYPYLTGSASWYLLTLVTRVFGVYGLHGDLALNPRLAAAQFDSNGNASVTTLFAGRRLAVIYQNPHKLDLGDYRVATITLDGKTITGTRSSAEVVTIPRNAIEGLEEQRLHDLIVQLDR
ncbi:MAG: GH36-type glycosyl hydrolase domain-containing protein [Chloroflexota bacterium]